MPTLLSGLLRSALNIPGVSSIRRNHGLEHATLHVLAERNPGISLAGHSDARGFWLIGNVDTADVRSAAQEALDRMKSGEHRLAVHANCGTNFVTAGTIAGVAGALAMFGVGRDWKSKAERLPLAATLATLGLIFSQPLGLKIQEQVTTSGHPEGLEVVDIIPNQRGRITAHRVLTRG